MARILQDKFLFISALPASSGLQLSGTRTSHPEHPPSGLAMSYSFSPIFFFQERKILPAPGEKKSPLGLRGYRGANAVSSSPREKMQKALLSRDTSRLPVLHKYQALRCSPKVLSSNGIATAAIIKHVLILSHYCPELTQLSFPPSLHTDSIRILKICPHHPLDCSDVALHSSYYTDLRAG